VEALLNERGAAAGDSGCIDEVPDVSNLLDVTKRPEVDKLPSDQDQQTPQKPESA
jgi:hypothetical protein